MYPLILILLEARKPKYIQVNETGARKQLFILFSTNFI